LERLFNVFNTFLGDGNYFCISHVHANEPRRVLKIYDREGSLQSISEPMAYLEQPVSWKPSGSLIASSQKITNKHMIVFFERNGLSHGSFNLPQVDCIVHELYWNFDSTVLAVFVQHQQHYYLQLWTTGNYHWYMKQCIPFDNYLKNVVWDPENPLKLHVLEKGLLKSLIFRHILFF
jgi:elongator complex protein 1